MPDAQLARLHAAKTLRLKFLAEHFDKRGAIHFCEERHRADDFDFAVMLDGAAIFQIRLANHDHAAKVKVRGAQRSDEKAKCD